MRFKVEIVLNEERIAKDKNRLFMSLMKHCFENESATYFNQMYKQEQNKTKPFSFSLYMGKCVFERETIRIKDRQVTLFFTTYDIETGIIFYNGMLKKCGQPYTVKGFTMTISQIRLITEKALTSNRVVFKTMSPLVIRDHHHDNHKTWYYDLVDETEDGQRLVNQQAKTLLVDNLRLQLEDQFGQPASQDVEVLAVQIEASKSVRVKHYGIDIVSNLCQLAIEGEPYLLDYIYKAGIGSRRSQGFGMLDIV